jgi:hypothetical protein
LDASIQLSVFLVIEEYSPPTYTTSQQKKVEKTSLVEAVTLGGGFEADEPKTSGFFKLKKIRTRGKL